MTPERWQRTEDLYHAAAGRPPSERAAFLLEACGSDDELRRDVESLLDESVEGFLDEPAASIAAHVSSGAPLALLEGQRLGAYEIQALLGAGGMGEVYRARDTRLGRDVAVKILPRAFTSDPDRLARLEREAHMLAALNHPNICAIYGLDEADGVRCLVLELVEGETLASRLAQVRGAPEGSGMPLRDGLAIARQIVDAIEAAHEKGIVHRDLKPANIKITSSGIVKVLDFGLAKAVSGDGSAPGLTRAMSAHAGAIVGTAAYMSPEQARGLPLDRRTDIWAFGCVLYEILTGRGAFAGETASDSLAKVLERDPDWSLLPAGTPASIVRLLARCLEKDQRRRLRDIGDARLEIDAPNEVPTGRDVVHAGPHSGSRWYASRVLPWAALVAVVTGVTAWELRRAALAPAPAWESPLANATFTHLTSWEGTEGAADISPDGRFVVVLADRDRPFDLWGSQIGTEVWENMTSGLPALARPPTLLRSLGFAGDGSEVWFGLSGETSVRNVLMPLAGSRPRPFLGSGLTAASWSADGNQLAFMAASPSGDTLLVADGTGSDAREIVPREPNLHNHNPVWSPDGEWIYFARGLDPTEAMDVWRVRAKGGTPERMTDQHAAINFLAPLDARTVLYVARDDNGLGPWLWALDVQTRSRHRVSASVEQYTSVAASRDGRRVVATVSNPVTQLSRVPIRESPAGEGDVERVALPHSRSLAPRFGGTSLFYLSTAGAGDGLWRAQDGRSALVRKGSDGALFEPPAISPDGSRVAIVLRREGKKRLVLMAADGTDSRTLSPSISVRGTADWAPDGESIVTGGTDESGPGLFRIGVPDGSIVRLVAGQAFNPVWSPEGTIILYANVEAGRVPLMGVRPDGSPVALPDIQVRPGGYRFLPDGKGLVYLPHIRSQDFWLTDLATGSSRQLTRLEDRGALQRFDISGDGRFIVFDRERENSNVVLIDLPR